MTEITQDEAKIKVGIFLSTKLEEVTDLPIPTCTLYNQVFPPDNKDDYWWFKERKEHLGFDGSTNYFSVHKKSGKVEQFTIS